MPLTSLLDLKQLIQDGNLQVYNVLCACTKKSLRSPRTQFRAGNISKFTGCVPPDPPHTIHIAGPHFSYLPWVPPILSVALAIR